MRRSAALLAVGFITIAAAAFDEPAARPSFQVAAQPIERISVAAGKPAPVTMRFQIVPGYHINSNLPGSELLIPTVLKLSPPTDIGVGRVKYPKGHELTLDIAPSEKLNVYTGDFAITAMVSALRTAVPGTYMVHGGLKYQACNDRACFPPREARVEFEVTVLKSRFSGRSRHNPPQSPHIHQ
jgi:hypothetical protein